ncbi:MAG: NADH-quinone oxidoreductase subunit L [Sphingomonadaceae bacterium]
MLQNLWLIPALPLAGTLILVLAGDSLPRIGVAVVGVGSVALSALLAILVAIDFVATPPPGMVFTQTLWVWMSVDGFSPSISFYLDALSLVFVLVVTFVGFLILLYSVEFMEGEEGYARFFAYMDLFVGSMLTLVLGSNLLVLFLGWEGVGLCSYLLIGFWYREAANGRAARKAFVVTRVGDTAFLIGLLLIFTNLGTLDVQELMARATDRWAVGSALAVAAATLLLGGALGKSAQLPLQTWLPDAMAGPTPVSALIHAATMVTAGVYLIARTHALFALAPQVQSAVAVIGAATLIYAGFSALTQRNIKRAIAYSTISQVGLMFLALGVGAWAAGVFHFVTHAFFKALMFLSAGVVILALHHEEDMFRMGGLRRDLPLAFWTFLIAAASLAGFPLVTAGFYSKEAILTQSWLADQGGPWFWAVGVAGALLTSVYGFRILFLVFFRDRRMEVERRPGAAMAIPLVVLAFLSLVAGFVEVPFAGQRLPSLSRFLETAVPATRLAGAAPGLEFVLAAIGSLASLAGIYLAYLFFQQSPRLASNLARTGWGATLRRFWLAGWGFDWLYDNLVVRPVVWFANTNRGDFVDLLYRGIAGLNLLLWRILGATQSGVVRRYAMGIAIGAAILIAIGVFQP